MDIDHNGVAVRIQPAETETGENACSNHDGKRRGTSKQEKGYRQQQARDQQHGRFLQPALQQGSGKEGDDAAEVHHAAHDALRPAGEVIGIHHAVDHDALVCVRQAV